MAKKYKIVIFLGSLVLILDQITKLWVQNNIPLWSGTTIIPGFFNLVHVLNKGAAFGFLNRADLTWQTYFFIAVSALAIVLIFHLVRTVDRNDQFLFTGLGLILGGALGNMVDRIRLGQVIDFLDFYLGTHHWPAFNVADIAISLGSLALLISFYKRKKNAS
ncbi:signal peptidase II [Desulfohalobiaceae bacterium Ax17]|jgi:signal peptidase II|uniref:signal peptidase II n=1 Tax=Desulfovulcanus ferrireducens TaxID=2831190 RepID=UPI00207BA8C3|nr:signal peptidase II [Desulfovulcanus ferrireducens]MBT8764055.1 signal peptidase II [Desulfovulcanus ferrireducens]